MGALFPIHKKGEGDTTPCGAIQREDGIQPLEAMLFTLDEINASNDLLPNITLGATAYDSCDNPKHAAETAMPLMRGFVARKVNLSCSSSSRSTVNNHHHHQNHHHQTEGWPCGWNIVGIVGPQTTAVSVRMAGLGGLFKVPQVSYLATSKRLCNKEEFPYFFRTVPSDVYQANAIVELLMTFKWNYAVVVHSGNCTDTNEGVTCPVT